MQTARRLLSIARRRCGACPGPARSARLGVPGQRLHARESVRRRRGHRRAGQLRRGVGRPGHRQPRQHGLRAALRPQRHRPRHGVRGSHRHVLAASRRAGDVPRLLRRRRSRLGDVGARGNGEPDRRAALRQRRQPAGNGVPGQHPGDVRFVRGTSLRRLQRRRRLRRDLERLRVRGRPRPRDLRPPLRQRGNTAGKRVPGEHLHLGVPPAARGRCRRRRRLRGGVGGRPRHRRQRKRRLRTALRQQRRLPGYRVQVNSYTTFDQGSPSVAADGAGDFTVVWSSVFQDGDVAGIFGQRFASNGSPRGTEFQVNSYATNDQVSPSVAADEMGNFVVAWTADEQDGSGSGIFAQRFDSTGASLGSEFQVNTYTAADEFGPSAASDDAGNFFISWSGDAQDGSGSGVFGQRFDSEGNAAGSEFQVNTFTAGDQAGKLPAVAACSPSGGCGATWGGRRRRYPSARPCSCSSTTTPATPPAPRWRFRWVNAFPAPPTRPYAAPPRGTSSSPGNASRPSAAT